MIVCCDGESLAMLARIARPMSGSLPGASEYMRLVASRRARTARSRTAEPIVSAAWRCATRASQARVFEGGRAAGGHEQVDEDVLGEILGEVGRAGAVGEAARDRARSSR